LDISVLHSSPPSKRNFRMTDWDKFKEIILDKLNLIPPPQEITSRAQMNTAVDDLTAAIQKTINKVVPINKPCPSSRRWWTHELSQMKKTQNR
ncbi:hypothetical protein BT96DRAFT_782726, partial [Gymnopus androsaceus JB14]